MRIWNRQAYKNSCEGQDFGDLLKVRVRVTGMVGVLAQQLHSHCRTLLRTPISSLRGCRVRVTANIRVRVKVRGKGSWVGNVQLQGIT